MKGAYSVGGDPRKRGYPTLESALSLAITLASRHELDEEEYRNGVFHQGTLVAVAIRHVDGSLTAMRLDRP